VASNAWRQAYQAAALAAVRQAALHRIGARRAAAKTAANIDIAS